MTVIIAPTASRASATVRPDNPGPDPRDLPADHRVSDDLSSPISTGRFEDAAAPSKTSTRALGKRARDEGELVGDAEHEAGGGAGGGERDRKRPRLTHPDWDSVTDEELEDMSEDERDEFRFLPQVYLLYEHEDLNLTTIDEPILSSDGIEGFDDLFDFSAFEDDSFASYERTGEGTSASTSDATVGTSQAGDNFWDAPWFNEIRTPSGSLADDERSWEELVAEIIPAGTTQISEDDEDDMEPCGPILSNDLTTAGWYDCTPFNPVRNHPRFAYVGVSRRGYAGGNVSDRATQREVNYAVPVGHFWNAIPMRIREDTHVAVCVTDHEADAQGLSHRLRSATLTLSLSLAYPDHIPHTPASRFRFTPPRGLDARIAIMATGLTTPPTTTLPAVLAFAYCSFEEGILREKSEFTDAAKEMIRATELSQTKVKRKASQENVASADRRKKGRKTRRGSASGANAPQKENRGLGGESVDATVVPDTPGSSSVASGSSRSSSMHAEEGASNYALVDPRPAIPINAGPNYMNQSEWDVPRYYQAYASYMVDPEYTPQMFTGGHQDTMFGQPSGKILPVGQEVFSNCGAPYYAADPLMSNPNGYGEEVQPRTNNYTWNAPREAASYTAPNYWTRGEHEPPCVPETTAHTASFTVCGGPQTYGGYFPSDMTFGVEGNAVYAPANAGLQFQPQLVIAPFPQIQPSPASYQEFFPLDQRTDPTRDTRLNDGISMERPKRSPPRDFDTSFLHLQMTPSAPNGRRSHPPALQHDRRARGRLSRASSVLSGRARPAPYPGRADARRLPVSVRADDVLLEVQRLEQLERARAAGARAHPCAYTGA
ncbi:uncharacterized protein BXZ73DRAFT_76503 [Epithele typhae]|uniref:uncharacterized protein n=1 Tax=Epithele typhae TaxID=378194 RepID=UPI002007A562|nr:uncharacterized protein BXZ73DRAFT_76503 [Epithele typhae]KAH9937875.1 hypothetical protein BXZ73DRAFT_76503 [Epithele typhae]